MPTIPKQINAIQESLGTNTVSVDPLFQPSRTLLPTKISNVDDQPLSSSPTWNVNHRGGQQNANISTESTSGDTSIAEYQNIVELIFQEVEVSMRQSMLPQFFYLPAFRARAKDRIEDYKHGLLLTGDKVPAGVELTAKFWDQRCRQAYNKHRQKDANINENPSPEPSLKDLYQTERAIAQQSARLVTDSAITVSPSLSGSSGPITKKQLAIYSLAISGNLNLNNPNPPQWNSSTRQDVVTKYRDVTQSNPMSLLPEASSNVRLNPQNEINLSVIATQEQETDYPKQKIIDRLKRDTKGLSAPLSTNASVTAENTTHFPSASASSDPLTYKELLQQWRLDLDKLQHLDLSKYSLTEQNFLAALTMMKLLYQPKLATLPSEETKSVTSESEDFSLKDLVASNAWDDYTQLTSFFHPPSRKKRNAQEEKINDDASGSGDVEMPDPGMSLEDFKKHFGPHNPLPFHAQDVLHRHFPLAKQTGEHKIATIAKECNLGTFLTSMSPILGLEGAVESLGKQIEEALSSKSWSQEQRIAFRERTLEEFEGKYAHLSYGEQVWTGFKAGFGGGPPAAYFINRLERDYNNGRKATSLTVPEIEKLKIASEAWQIITSLVPGVVGMEAAMDLVDALREGKKDICRLLTDLVLVALSAVDLGEGIVGVLGERMEGFTFADLEEHTPLSSKSKQSIKDSLEKLKDNSKHDHVENVPKMLEEAKKKSLDPLPIIKRGDKEYVIFDDGFGHGDVFKVENKQGEPQLFSVDGSALPPEGFKYSDDGTYLIKDGWDLDGNKGDQEGLEQALKETHEHHFDLSKMYEKQLVKEIELRKSLTQKENELNRKKHERDSHGVMNDPRSMRSLEEQIQKAEQEIKKRQEELGEHHWVRVILEKEKNRAELGKDLLQQEHKQQMISLEEDQEILNKSRKCLESANEKKKTYDQWKGDYHNLKSKERELNPNSRDPVKQKELQDFQQKLKDSQEKYVEDIRKHQQNKKDLKEAKQDKRHAQDKKHQKILTKIKEEIKDQKESFDKKEYSAVKNEGDGKKVMRTIDSKDYTYDLEKDHHGTTYRLKSRDKGAPKDFSEYIINNKGELERASIKGGAGGEEGEIAGSSHDQPAPTEPLSEAKQAELRKDPYYKALLDARKVHEQIRDLKAQLKKNKGALEDVRREQKALTPEGAELKQNLSQKEKELLKEQHDLSEKQKDLFKNQGIKTSHEESKVEIKCDKEKHKQRGDAIRLKNEAEARIPEDIKQQLKNSLDKSEKAKNKFREDRDAKEEAETRLTQHPSDRGVQQDLIQAKNNEEHSLKSLKEAQEDAKKMLGLYEAEIEKQNPPSMPDLLKRQKQIENLERKDSVKKGEGQKEGEIPEIIIDPPEENPPEAEEVHAVPKDLLKLELKEMIKELFDKHKVGIPEDHAIKMQDVARHLDTVYSIRPVDWGVRSLIDDGFPSKDIRVKGKSANWGPQNGFIPIDQLFSKKEGSLTLIEKQNAAIEGGLQRDDFGKVGLKISESRIQELADSGSITVSNKKPSGELTIEAKADRPGQSGESYSFKAIPDPFNKKMKLIYYKDGPGYRSLEVVAELKLKEPLTADYDIFFVAGSMEDFGTLDQRTISQIDLSSLGEPKLPLEHRSVSGADSLPKIPSHLTGFSEKLDIRGKFQQNQPKPLGAISHRVKELMEAINKALDRGERREMVHHGEDAGNPHSDMADNFPATAYLPRQLKGTYKGKPITLEPVVVLKDLEAYLGFVSIIKENNYHFTKNPNWPGSKRRSFEDAMGAFKPK